VLSSPLERVYAIVILSLAILAIGLVMLKGVFGKVTASVAILTGILGNVSIAGWSDTIILNAVLATLWVVLVGYRLVRLSQHATAHPVQHAGHARAFQEARG
jgi:hypothetical protein